MKKFFKKVGQIFCGAVLIGALGINSVSAEESVDAKAAFREAMKNSTDGNRIFHEDIYFVVPTCQSELDFIGRAEGENFKAAGDFNIWLTDASGNSSELIVPFYVTQSAKEMQIYFAVDNKWKKFQSPSLAAVMTDTIATPNADEVENFMSDIKEVVLLRETDTEQTFLVNLDVNKIADEIKAEAKKNPADNGTAGEEIFQEKFLTYLDSGLRDSEIWYTWTVNKQNWNTIALSLNLTGAVQQVARAMLNDESQNWGAFEKNILETVAFYSETKAFTTFLNDEAAKKLEIPKKALNAKLVSDLVESKK